MSGQTVLITGATGGLGRETALLLAQQGNKVIATGRNKDALDALLRVRPQNELEVIVMDITSESSVINAQAQVDQITEGRGIDVLINNAAIAQGGPLSEIDDADLQAQFETNVFGLMRVTRAFLPSIRARGRGRIINVSSTAGRITVPLSGAYCASKYAVESLSDALRLELAPFGIEVVVIEPGPIRTDFAARTMDAASKYTGATSPYAPLFHDLGKLQQAFESGAIEVEKVARVIARAVTDSPPRVRYLVPGSGRLLLWLFALLPTRWTDSMLRSRIGLTARNLQKRPLALK